MKYYKHIDGRVFAFESDGSQDHLITEDMVEMSQSEIDDHIGKNKPSTEYLISNYADEYIQQDVSHNGYTLKNTVDNQKRVSVDLAAWMIDPSIETIKFEHDGGIDDITYSDLQGLMKCMFAREQSGRKAEAFVLAKHAQTPYTDIQDAYDDFDGEVE